MHACSDLSGPAGCIRFNETRKIKRDKEMIGPEDVLRNARMHNVENNDEDPMRITDSTLARMGSVECTVRRTARSSFLTCVDAVL